MLFIKKLVKDKDHLTSQFLPFPSIKSETSEYCTWVIFHLTFYDFRKSFYICLKILNSPGHTKVLLPIFSNINTLCYHCTVINKEAALVCYNLLQYAPSSLLLLLFPFLCSFYNVAMHIDSRHLEGAKSESATLSIFITSFQKVT